MVLTPEITQWLIYAGIAVGGAIVKHYFPNIIPFLSSTPATPATPATPGTLSIGHGELLALLLTALKTDPNKLPQLPASPSVPAPQVPAA
jgi:hypothetical protein